MTSTCQPTKLLMRATLLCVVAIVSRCAAAQPPLKCVVDGKSSQVVNDLANPCVADIDGEKGYQPGISEACNNGRLAAIAVNYKLPKDCTEFENRHFVSIGCKAILRGAATLLCKAKFEKFENVPDKKKGLLIMSSQMLKMVQMQFRLAAPMTCADIKTPADRRNFLAGLAAAVSSATSNSSVPVMSEMMEYTRSMANFVCGAAGNRVRRADSSITVSVLLDPAVPVKLVADSTANFTEDFGPGSDALKFQYNGKTVSATPTGAKVMSRNDIVAALKAKVIEDKAALAAMEAAYAKKCAVATTAGCAEDLAEVEAQKATVTDTEKQVTDNTPTFPVDDEGKCPTDLVDEKLCEVACAEVQGSTESVFHLLDDPGKIETKPVQLFKSCICKDDAGAETEYCREEIDLTLPLVGIIILICCCCGCCCFCIKKCCCSGGGKDGKKEKKDTSANPVFGDEYDGSN